MESEVSGHPCHEAKSEEIESAVLIVGGTGTVGRWVCRWMRQRLPELPLLVGSRNLTRANEAAEQIGGRVAGVVIDLDRRNLALPDDLPVSAVVMLAPDEGLNGLRLALDRKVPYLSIGDGLIELGPELALFAHRPDRAPVILASHWLAGAALFLALDTCGSFDHVDSIRIGALIDEQDEAGPLALADMERLQAQAASAFVIDDGRRAWISGDAAHGSLVTLDGREVDAEAYAPLDPISLSAVTSAWNIRFDLATGTSSSRARGEGVATEITVEAVGSIDGDQGHRRQSSLEFAPGQAALTGLGVTLALEAVWGLGSQPTPGPGLYLPELLITPDAYLSEVEAAGAVICRGA